MDQNNERLPQTNHSSELLEIPSSSPQQVKNSNLKVYSHKKLLISALILVIVTAGTTAVIFHGMLKNNSSQSAQKTSSLKGVDGKSANAVNATLITDNAYLDAPKKLSDLKFFKNTDVFGQTCTGANATQCTNSIALSDISYYQVGATKDSKNIIIFILPGGIDTVEAFALENKDKTYDILGQMSPVFSDSQAPAIQSLNNNVKVNQSIILNDVTFPVNTTLGNQKVKTDFKDPSIMNSNFMEKGITSIRGAFYGETKYGSPTKLVSKNNLDFYEITSNDDPTFQVKEIYGVFKQLFAVPYILDDELSSTDGKLSISWTNGAKNSSAYFSGGQGCGSRGYVVAKNVNKAKLITVGKSSGGQDIYQLPVNNPLVQEIYTKDYDKGSLLEDASLKNFTLQQFNDNHSYFLAQNGLGEYVAYQRDDLFIRGGCAKPVIYLYPKSDTKVSVALGAQITKSEPSYSATGWQNVRAHPDGSLEYKGLKYPYLFWEGYGNGIYPNINYGTIVKSGDANITVQKQLAQQGLNQKEIKDFMDFWGPKLNTGKPYVRISWLNTGQMNQLAPLYVNPRPTTTIRVFLDFEGLNKPYSLTAQKLSKPNRTGFTVVEWGGLMRDGLN
jgi:hypothetical protein